METQKEIEITNSIRKKFVVSSLENISAFIFLLVLQEQTIINHKIQENNIHG